jgi:hypothetical protein
VAYCERNAARAGTRTRARCRRRARSAARRRPGTLRIRAAAAARERERRRAGEERARNAAFWTGALGSLEIFVEHAGRRLISRRKCQGPGLEQQSVAKTSAGFQLDQRRKLHAGRRCVAAGCEAATTRSRGRSAELTKPYRLTLACNEKGLAYRKPSFRFAQPAPPARVCISAPASRRG